MTPIPQAAGILSATPPDPADAVCRLADGTWMAIWGRGGQTDLEIQDWANETAPGGGFTAPTATAVARRIENVWYWVEDS